MTAKKTITPTVKPNEVAEGGRMPEDFDVEVEGKIARQLPPIHRIKPPKMQHNATKIRWYLGIGYTVKEVSNFLGIRYQQVRNVGVTAPKRAAREDVPPYVIELFDIEDDFEAMEHAALEQQMMAQRNQDRQARRDHRLKRNKIDGEAEQY
jgi:hypothetical protein